MGKLPLVLLLAGALSEGADNPEARAVYERALTALETRTREGLSEARLLFEQATALDPSFAEARAGAADASCLLALYGYEASSRVMPRAREAAAEALRIDPELARAHASLGLVRYLYDWSFSEAEQSFEKAFELDPEYPPAHHWYAMMLMASGRYEESLERVEKAIALDPGSALYDVKRGTVLMAAGRLDEAEAHLRAVLERRPGSSLARRELGLLELSRGRPESALPLLDPSEPARGLALARLGRGSEVASMLASLSDLRSTDYVSPIDFALLYAGIGDKEAALGELERAFEERDAALVYLRTQPGLAPLRSEPRFQEILKRIGI
jgi:tetratricopeptide (TPR) repeat protein